MNDVDRFEAGNRFVLLEIADQLREQAAQLEREAFSPKPTQRERSAPYYRLDLLNCELDPDATEKELLGRDYGDDGSEATARRSVLAARVGRTDDALVLAARAESAPDFTANSRVAVSLARALISLTEGRPAEAYDGLLVAIADGRDAGSDVGVSTLVGVFAEAGIRSRRTNEAQFVMDQWLARTGLDVNDPTNTEPFIGSALLRIANAATFALVLPAGDALPTFAVARLQLAAGMWLRRNRRIVEARGYLTSAALILSRPGGQPWQMLCESELTASSMTRGSAEGTAALSPQQLVVAKLVARGLSNQEIASQLCLSPRTVSSHLYRIFPMLGISSRSQLVAALLASELSAA
jgi:DNA-binding CsgD family transcriptional regulator